MNNKSQNAWLKTQTAWTLIIVLMLLNLSPIAIIVFTLWLFNVE